MFNPRIFTLFLPFICLFFAFSQTTIAQNNTNEQFGTIVAQVIAFREAKGNIQLVLFNKASDFPELEKKYKLERVSVTSKSVVEVRFENVPYGTYAIAGLHDENKSGNMDYTWLGLPEEGYCFSNDCKPFLSAPSFSQAKFTLNQKEKVLKITMQY